MHPVTPPCAVTKLREDVFAGETARRSLHNQLQELKGNVRVLVRVRPFLPADAAPTAMEADGAGEGDEGEWEGGEAGEAAAAVAGDAAPVPAIRVALDGTSLEIAPPASRSTKVGPARRDDRPLRFEFDTVLGPTADQSDVFHEVQHLVQSALDGYNVCIFS
jgi:kinesin family member C1